ncbi:MAG: phosphoribosylformylglycinamidine synthase subunit PurQ [Actinomycetota bacterium]
MIPTIGVVVFPGSNCDRDAGYSFDYLGAKTRFIWHLETDLSGIDAVVLPGGFSYGDYLRTGAMAAYSPVMSSVRAFAAEGKPVIGICNGFQILCEAGALPGALRRNRGLRFRCMPVRIRVETNDSPFTANSMWPGQILTIPIAHFDGNYYCTDEDLEELIAEQRIAFRYCDAEGDPTDESNPNGSLWSIAGILNEQRNVLGMMPHPERAVDPAVGGTDGKLILSSMLTSMVGSEAGE